MGKKTTILRDETFKYSIAFMDNAVEIEKDGQTLRWNASTDIGALVEALSNDLRFIQNLSGSQPRRAPRKKQAGKGRKQINTVMGVSEEYLKSIIQVVNQHLSQHPFLTPASMQELMRTEFRRSITRKSAATYLSRLARLGVVKNNKAGDYVRPEAKV